MVNKFSSSSSQHGLFRARLLLLLLLGPADLVDEVGAQRRLVAHGQPGPGVVLGLLAAPAGDLGAEPGRDVRGRLVGDFHGEQVALALEDDLGDAAGGGAAAAAQADAAGGHAQGAHVGGRDVARAAVHEERARTHRRQAGEDHAALGAVERERLLAGRERGGGRRLVVWRARLGDGECRGRGGRRRGYVGVEGPEEGEDFLVLGRAQCCAGGGGGRAGGRRGLRVGE